MWSLVVDLPMQMKLTKMDGSMKLTQGRRKHYLTQIKVIILVLSCFILPIIVQQGKSIKQEYNLPYQECTYEVQEQGAFFFFFLILIHICPRKFPGKKTFVRNDQIISGKIDELFIKIHLCNLPLKRIHLSST